MQLALVTYFWIMLGFAFFNGTLFSLEKKKHSVLNILMSEILLKTLAYI
jgi:hypothetical protein